MSPYFRARTGRRQQSGFPASKRRGRLLEPVKGVAVASVGGAARWVMEVVLRRKEEAMSEETKLVRLKCIRSHVFDTHGELVLRVPVDATEKEIRDLGGEQGVDWRFLPWHQISEPELSCRADDPLCIDMPAITEIAEVNSEPHGVVIRSDGGLQIKWPQ